MKSKDNRQICKRCGRYMVLDNNIGWSHDDSERYKCKCGMTRLISATPPCQYDSIRHKELEVKDD